MTSRILVLQTLPRPQAFSPNNALITLARHLDRHRYEMFVAVPREGRLTEALEAAGVRVFRVPGLRTYRRHDAVWRLPLVALRSAKLARRVGADLVVANHAELGPFAHAAARLNGVPWICFLRQADRSDRYYRKYRLARANAVAGVSDASLGGYRAFLHREALAPNPTVAIPTGMDPAPSGARAGEAAVRKSLGWSASERVVGSVGLREIKRPELLLEILARVTVLVPDVRCILVGGADVARQRGLDSIAASLRLADRVRFAGQQREMDPYYRALDVYAHASRSEGFPKAILEAMAHGLPVVAFRVGGIPEAVVDGSTGVLCAPDDREAFAAALARLLGDRELARAMGEAGRRRVEEVFSPVVMARSAMELFDRVLGESRRRGPSPESSAPATGGPASPAAR